MYRNQYDTEVLTFSPAGRLHQVEYAMEAIKQGLAAVGLRSRDHVVIACLKRAISDLAAPQPKVFRVDEHMMIAISGLIPDGRALRKYMMEECLNHRFVYDAPLAVGRLVTNVADKAQRFTQRSEKRPYGVGLLVGGVDQTGPHLFQVDPSGNFTEFIAHAFGSRAQTAKTYLEKHYKTFEEEKLEGLIRHALIALKTAAPENKIDDRTVTVSYVGRDTPLTILDDADVKPLVDRVADAAVEIAPVSEEEDKDEAGAGAGAGGAAGAATAEEAGGMEDEGKQ
jgi:20S proteasome subunit alpha 6